MIKKLVKHGNSYALIIDKAILELLKITPDTPLEVTTDGKGFYVGPPNENETTPGEKEFQEALDYVNKRYGKVLKRLAKYMERDA